MRNLNWILVIMLLGILFVGCSDSTKQPKAIAKHVVMIGLDGFGSYAYDKADMPNLKEFAKSSSWTLNSRSVLPSSSAVNWASMLMSSSPTLHGYTEWGSQVPEIPSAVVSQYGKYPSIYTLLKEQQPLAKTAVVYSWGGIIHFLEDDIIDFNIPTEGNDDLCAEKAAELIETQQPTFTFIHFDQPDGAGHKYGHDSPGYYNELKHVDDLIGIVLAGVEKSGVADETVVLILADHGGIDYGHGGKSMEEVRIPFFAKGPGVKAGHEISSIMVDYDYGAIVARILGVTPHQAWRGQVVEEMFK